MKTKLLLAMSLVVGLTVVAPNAAGAADFQVSMVDFAYSPASITVNVGDRVTWTNNGFESHTVTAVDNFTRPPGDSGSIPRGGQYSFTFNTVGRWEYFCQIHGIGLMSGVVTVSSGSATVISSTTLEPGDSFTASATGVASASSGYVLRMAGTSAACPTGIALGGTRNSDPNFTITPVSRIIPTNQASGTRWLCWVRVGDPTDFSTPRQVTLV
ncbi:MAG: plastocyanin/azurin family copper-binding protein [Acidimicrobiales bacterium]